MCDHASAGAPKRILFYNSVADRLITLLNSDVGNFFSYLKLRPKVLDPFTYNDIFDGSVWKWFDKNKPVGSTLIGIQMCWDGAQVFDPTSKSMWPILWSIINFPPELRDKPFLGLHMASLDTCSIAAIQVFVDELQQLWDIGFNVNGRHYVVALIEIICDGRGREKIKKVQGGGSSIAGCHICDFKGYSFAKRIVFRRWQR